MQHCLCRVVERLHQIHLHASAIRDILGLVKAVLRVKSAIGTLLCPEPAAKLCWIHLYARVMQGTLELELTALRARHVTHTRVYLGLVLENQPQIPQYAHAIQDTQEAVPPVPSMLWLLPLSATLDITVLGPAVWLARHAARNLHCQHRALEQRLTIPRFALAFLDTSALGLFVRLARLVISTQLRKRSAQERLLMIPRNVLAMQATLAQVQIAPHALVTLTQL